MLTAYGQQVLNWMMLRRFNRIEGSDTTFIIQNNGWNCRITGPITSRRIRLSGETHLHPSLMLFALRVQHLSTATVSVSADVDDDGTVQHGITVGTASGHLHLLDRMTEAREFLTCRNPAQAIGTTVYYLFYAVDNGGGISLILQTLQFHGSDPQLQQCPSEDFATGFGDCYTYSVSGNTKYWTYSASGYVYMNGHNSGDVEEDWLILPGINFDSYDDLILSFDTWYNYGTDDADNYLKLMYSTDYAGIGNPALASWTEIPYTSLQPPNLEFLWPFNIGP